MPTCAELAINNWKGQQCCKVFLRHKKPNYNAKRPRQTHLSIVKNSHYKACDVGRDCSSDRQWLRLRLPAWPFEEDQCEWWQNCHDNKSSIIMCQAMRQCQLANWRTDALTDWPTEHLANWLKQLGLPQPDALQCNWRELSTLCFQHGKQDKPSSLPGCPNTTCSESDPPILLHNTLELQPHRKLLTLLLAITDYSWKKWLESLLQYPAREISTDRDNKRLQLA